MLDQLRIDIRRWPIFWRINPEVVSRVRYACVFGQRTEVIFITIDDEVFAVGSNSKGCLGVGDTNTREAPTRVDILCGKKVTTVATGHHSNVLAVTADGELYVWGDNSHGQLGIGTHSLIYSPQICQDLERHKVKLVACGSEHSLILTENNEVFGWGSNENGQVGSDRYASTEATPVKVEGLPDNRPVEFIICSSNSSYALTTGGLLYGWGYNGNGELGIDTFETKSTPQRVGAHRDLVFQSVACGSGHVIALDHEGRIFAWGHNYYGEVGIGGSSNIATPTHVPIENLIFVEVGANHISFISVAVTHCGRVYAWGQLKDKAERHPILTSFTSIYDVFSTLSDASVSCVVQSPEDGDNGDQTIQSCLRFHLNNDELSDVEFVIGDQRLHAHVSFLRMRSKYFRAMLSTHWVREEKKPETELMPAARPNRREKNKASKTPDSAPQCSKPVKVATSEESITAGVREIELQGYSYDIYRAYLEHLYTDTLQIDANIAMELLQLADEYCEDELKLKCENVLLTFVTTDNVFKMYANAKKLSAKKLEEFCFHFAIARLNAATQTESFRHLDNAIAKEFFQTAGKRDAFRN